MASRPSVPCRHPACPAIVPGGTGGYCPLHKKGAQSQYNKQYDRTSRDQRAAKFYSSVSWQRLRQYKLQRSPLCEVCQAAGRIAPAALVHHVVEIKDDWSKRLHLDNLQSCCERCHQQIHSRK